MLMTLTPEPARPHAVKTYQILIFAGTCVGPLIGGALADQMGFKPVFLISGAGRLLAALLLWALIREPRHRQPAMVTA
jgi:MFS family permease